MTLKEKLANDYQYNWHAQHGPGATAKDIEQAFLSGFETARKMAAKIAYSPQFDGTGDAIDELGEKEME